MNPLDAIDKAWVAASKIKESPDKVKVLRKASPAIDQKETESSKSPDLGNQKQVEEIVLN